MTYIIDTGITEPDAAGLWKISKRDGLANGVLDSLPAGAPQSAIDAATLAAILGDLHTPKLMRTVRMHFIALWPLIQELAFREPAAFDEILVAYAELSTVLPEDRAGRKPASTSHSDF